MIAERFITVARRAARQPRSWLASGGREVSPVGPDPSAAITATAGVNMNAKTLCAKQRAQCVSAVAEFCTTWIDHEACESKFLHCCARFADCNVELGIACLFLVE
jgi:hypothetical protein